MKKQSIYLVISAALLLWASDIFADSVKDRVSTTPGNLSLSFAKSFGADNYLKLAQNIPANGDDMSKVPDLSEWGGVKQFSGKTPSMSDIKSGKIAINEQSNSLDTDLADNFKSLNSAYNKVYGHDIPDSYKDGLQENTTLSSSIATLQNQFYSDAYNTFWCAAMAEKYAIDDAKDEKEALATESNLYSAIAKFDKLKGGVSNNKTIAYTLSSLTSNTPALQKKFTDFENEFQSFLSQTSDDYKNSKDKLFSEEDTSLSKDSDTKSVDSYADGTLTAVDYNAYLMFAKTGLYYTKLKLTLLMSGFSCEYSNADDLISQYDAYLDNLKEDFNNAIGKYAFPGITIQSYGYSSFYDDIHTEGYRLDFSSNSSDLDSVLNNDNIVINDLVFNKSYLNKVSQTSLSKIFSSGLELNYFINRAMDSGSDSYFGTKNKVIEGYNGTSNLGINSLYNTPDSYDAFNDNMRNLLYVLPSGEYTDSSSTQSVGII